MRRRRERRRSPAATWAGVGRIQVTVIVAMLLVTLAGAAGTWILWGAGERDSERDWAERAATTLREQVDRNGATLLGLRGLFDASSVVTEEQFSRYSAAQFGRSPLFGLAWMPRVPASERAAFEHRYGVPITQLIGAEAVGSPLLRASGPKAEYFPLAYVAKAAAAAGLAVPVGLDALDDPGQAASAQAARDTGEPAMAPLLRSDRGTLLLLDIAIYEPASAANGTVPQRRAALRGFVGAGVMLDDLVDPVRALLPPGSELQIAEGGRPLLEPAGALDGTSRTLELAGRRWTVVLRTPGSMAGWVMTGTILGGGLLLAGLVALLFVQGNRREREQAALRRVATTAAATPEDVFALVAKEAALLLGADAGLVARFADDVVHPAGSWGEIGGGGRATPSLEGAGVLARVAATGGPARLDDHAALPADDSVVRTGWADRLGSAVAAPVRVGSTLWGALLVARRNPQPFPAGTEERLARFAELVATAISSAEVHQELALAATTDPLTGLANRRTFEERLHGEVTRARRAGSQLALVLFDIDHFKRVNDAYGHQTGDRVLVEVSSRLRALSRPQDLLARIGGEEFAWIITDTDAMGGLAAAERARARISDSPVGHVGRITLSAGVCDLALASDPRGLLRGADVALYWAKGNGRDASARYTAGWGAGGFAETPPLLR